MTTKNSLANLEIHDTIKVPIGRNVHITVGEEYATQPPYKAIILLPYSPIRSMRMKYAKTNQAEDIFDLLGQVTKSAYDLFILLKLKTNRKDNLCYYPINQFNQLETTVFNKKMSQLKQVDIFKRAKTVDKSEPIKPGTFMLNPYLVQPPKRF